MKGFSFFHGPVQQSRRFPASRRLRAVLTYGCLAVGLVLAVTDVCRLAVASPSASARPFRAR